MRFSLLIFALLVFANVTVLLWPDTARTAPHVYAPKSEINPHFVRLNKEIEDKYLAAKPTTITDEQMEIANSEDQGCFRLGPFMHRENYELAQAVLFNANMRYRKSTRPSKKSNMYRVYLGPFDNQPEAADMRTKLKRDNLLDHFVRKESDEEYIVSLGIFSTEKSALNAVQLFDGRLDSVKLKQEMVVLPESYWLHFSIDEGDVIKQQLARMDWGEPSAKLGIYQCLPA